MGRTPEGIERERERARAAMRERRARDRADHGSARKGTHERVRTAAIADALDLAFASERRAFRARGRTLTTAPHTCAKHGAVLFIDLRPSRGDGYRARTITRGDGGWDARARFGDVHACTHGGHEVTHTHGAPLLPRWFARVLTVAASLTPGHDAEHAGRASTIAECAAALTPGYVIPTDGATWARERAEHERTCSDCKGARMGVTATNTRRDDRAELPLTRATRDAIARLARTRPTTREQRKIDARARARDLRALDARIDARE